MKSNIYISALKNYPMALVRTAFLMLCLCFIGTQVSAQSASADKNIKGIVKFSEDNEPAPGVNIYLKGSTAEGTYSNAKGQFEFPRLLKTGDVLVFSFIGRKTIEYAIPGLPAETVEIVMIPELIEMVEDVLVEGEASPHQSRTARVIRTVKP